MVTVAELSKIRRLLNEAAEELARMEVQLQRQTLLEPEHWVDTGAAAEAVGRSESTVRYWAREHGFGRKNGGRWEVNMPALRNYLKREKRQ